MIFGFFRNGEVTIPEICLFNNWIQRSLCVELTFVICVFSAFAVLLFLLSPSFWSLCLLLLSCCSVFRAPLRLSSVCFVIFVLLFGSACAFWLCFVSVFLLFFCALSGFLCSSVVFRVRFVFRWGLKN